MIHSIGIVECGYEFEKLGVYMDWQKYAGLVLEDIPMKVAAKGFGGSEEGDWRNSVPSIHNITMIYLLAKLAHQEPEVVAFDEVVFSEGADVLAGRGAYVYLETKRNVFRIKEDTNPSLDYVLSKKAEMPTVFPTVDGGPSFCVFEEEQDQAWRREHVDSRKEEVAYTTGPWNRTFEVVEDALVVTQAPYDGGEIYFEVLPHQCLFYRLEFEKDGQLTRIPFTRQDGCKQTVLTELGSWFSIIGSLRLKKGNVKVSFTTELRCLRIDHVAANPYGKLRVWARCAPQEKLAVKVETL